MKTYFIVQGRATCPETWLPRIVCPSSAEWQFSDGLPGERTESYDYLDCLEGIGQLSPAIFITEDWGIIVT